MVRGGYGMFYGFLGQRHGDVLQSGFSANTLMMPTLDNGGSYIKTMANPFRSGIVEPQGAARSAASRRATRSA